ncbi:MAG TPA: hypothetical protein VJO33_12655, partial [Gemmatimonadaceae bacterium]|nr:hypothetical protein [Gemmatimonadaceae bacterium]
MGISIVKIVVGSLVLFSLAACADQKDPLAPSKPSFAFTGPGRGGPPPHIPGPYDVIEITAGSYHTCARQRSGEVFCWGQNFTSQIGVATTAMCGIYGAQIACAPVPVRVGIGTFASAIHVTAGFNHTCVLDTANAAWCWGSNDAGAIGKGTSGDAPTPVRVAGSQTTFTALAAGGDATCGSVVGLWCWGNYPGGSSAHVYSPNFIPSSALNPLVVTLDHICGNSGSGQWLCWGS